MYARIHHAGVRRQPHAELRVETIDGREQAQIALLHQVEQVARRPPVTTGRRAPPASGSTSRGGTAPRESPVLAVAAGELLLFLTAERRVPAHLRQVAAERVRRTSAAARAPGAGRA